MHFEQDPSTAYASKTQSRWCLGKGREGDLGRGARLDQPFRLNHSWSGCMAWLQVIPSSIKAQKHCHHQKTTQATVRSIVQISAGVLSFYRNASSSRDPHPAATFFSFPAPRNSTQSFCATTLMLDLFLSAPPHPPQSRKRTGINGLAKRTPTPSIFSR